MKPDSPRRLFEQGKLNLRFRHKVALGVGLVMGAGLISGINAIYNVRAVGTSVNFSVEAASPLLIGVISLSESYQKLQSVFDPVMKNCAGLGPASQYLALSQQNQRVKLEGLKSLATKADAATELARYEFSGQKIFKTRQALIDVCHRNISIRGDISIAEKGIQREASRIALNASKSIYALESQFRDLIHRREGNLTLPAIPQLDVKVAQLASQEAWLRIREFYRIKIYVSELVATKNELSNINKRMDLDRRLAAYRARVAGLETTLRSLKPYYVEGGHGKEYDVLMEGVKSMKDMVFAGETSLFASYHQLLEREKQKQSLVFRLQREEGQYSVALLNIMDVSQRINRNAQLATERSANLASWEIAAGFSVATVLLLLIGWYFKVAVTKPLESLTRNISALGRALRDDRAPVDETLTSRVDEIGDLAQQFNKTFLALAEARHELQESSRAEIALQRDRLHGAIEHMPQGLYMLDDCGRIIVANRQLSRIYNLDQNTRLEGMTVAGFIALCREKGAGVAKVISDGDVASGDASSRQSTSQRIVQLDDGRYMTMTAMKLADGGHVVTHEDITEKKTASDRIAHMALHDALTGLANRTLFRNHISWETESAATRREAGALLFLDLDRFKIVNDTLGHPTGDSLLIEVAHRLKDQLDDNCFAARLGGDEFAIYQSAGDQPQDAAALADKIIRSLCEPFDIDGHHIIIGTSVGIALYPDHAATADELLKNADLALYCSKQAGRGQSSFFEADMDLKMRDWHRMEHDLREAIQEGQFELRYQPMVRLDDESVTGFEALVRWRHPERGFISPADFIPIAEETGLIHELGAWILEEACRTAMSWPSHISVSVNISPVQFGAASLPLVVLSALERSGLPADRLMLEITEGVFLNDNAQTAEILDQLKEIGVSFAMDDFGTGYSSLSYIRRFQFDKIKIDQSFVRDLASNAESLAIVRAVTNLCRDLGMITTAEGVETVEQAEILKELGCVLAQGYHFGRPVPDAEVAEMFAVPKRVRA